MLTKGSNPHANDLDSAYSSIHNYYEKLVIEALAEHPEARALSRDMRADLACVALNSLPSKYIRHDVDMAFFLSVQDQQALSAQVSTAVNNALAQLARDPAMADPSPKTPSETTGLRAQK